MIALSLFREDKLSLLNSCICVIDEFHVTIESYDRIRRDIIWRNIRTLDLLAKKTSNLRVQCRRRGAKQREQPFTVRCGQDDRRPLFSAISLEVVHVCFFRNDHY